MKHLCLIISLLANVLQSIQVLNKLPTFAHAINFSLKNFLSILKKIISLILNKRMVGNPWLFHSNPNQKWKLLSYSRKLIGKTSCKRCCRHYVVSFRPKAYTAQKYLAKLKLVIEEICYVIRS